MLGAMVLSVQYDASGKEKCGPGSFYFTTACYDCYSGCYCTGSTKENYLFDPKDKIATVDVSKWCAGTENTCPNANQDDYGACGKSAAGVHRCPEGFRHSDKAQVEIECYGMKSDGWDADKVFYHTVVNCAPGWYLPKKKTQCVRCPTNENKYCPGSASENGFWVSFVDDHGLKICESGYRPNANLTDCDKIPDPVECIQGSFLPANSKDCAECLDGFVCPGALDENNKLLNKPGEYAPGLAVKQGIYYPDEICTGADEIVNRNKSGCTSCGVGKKANDAHTECVDAEIEVPAGKYLPANRVEPVDCTGAKKFCPGGKFMKKEIEQGRYDCPFNSTPKKINPTSPGFDGCDLKLTQEQMKNGISGSGECWKKTDPDDYRYCIYGMRFELPNNYMGGGKGPAVYNLPSIPYMQATITSFVGEQ